MIKKILLYSLIGIVALSAYLYLNLKDSRTLITPYPYSFQENFIQSFKKESAQDIKMAESAQVLILGDQFGRSLDPYLEGIKEEHKNYLKFENSIFNWSGENESLARTLFKLKSLNQLPPIIIYMGSNSELKEQRFNVADSKAILHNFNVFEDEKLISLIITFPFLSKIFYQKVQYFNLNKFKPYTNLQGPNYKLIEKEIAYKLYQYEMRDLINYIKLKKSDLILISTPINLLIEPKETCSHTLTDGMIPMLQEVEKLLNDSQTKAALPIIEKLSEVAFSNARVFYLLGMTQLRSGDVKSARESLHKAVIFDCQNWRSSAVYNAIMAKEAKSALVSFIDFDQILNSRLHRNDLFLDEIYPHNSLYLQLVSEINQTFKSFFRTN